MARLIPLKPEEYEARLARRQALSAVAEEILTRKMFSALAEGNPTELEAHLACGAHPNAFNDYGQTPLFVVGAVRCAKQLLRARVDCRQTNAEGTSPLVHHIQQGNLAIAIQIHAHGGVDITDSLRDMALYAAQEAGERGAVLTYNWARNVFGRPSSAPLLSEAYHLLT